MAEGNLVGFVTPPPLGNLIRRAAVRPGPGGLDNLNALAINPRGDPRIQPGEPLGNEEEVEAPILYLPNSREDSLVSQEPLMAAMFGRIAIYNGRNDTFVFGWETPPDWDVEDGKTWKLLPEHACIVAKVLRGIGIKISDKTGGELTAVELERESR